MDTYGDKSIRVNGKVFRIESKMIVKGKVLGGLTISGL
jgi:hypothetical protein